MIPEGTEILSTTHMEGKQIYKVKPGDSFFAITDRYHTTIDMIMHLNGLMHLSPLQPGDELTVMPLNFRVLVEPHKKVLSLWDDGRFVREYTLLSAIGAPGGDMKTKIEGKSGIVGDRRIPPAAAGYRGSTKIMTLEKMALAITSMPKIEGESEEDLAQGLYLAPADAEELALLLRPGNEVEFRSSTR